MKIECSSRESFIGYYQLSDDLCDLLLHQFDNDVSLLRKDEFRGYTRLSSRRIDPIVEEKYLTEVRKFLQVYSKEYSFMASSCKNWDVNPPFNLQRYEVGEFYKHWHCEGCGPRPNNLPLRHLVFMTYLNDLEDGHTEFFYQRIKVTPRKGRTLIWPAGWTHMHRGNPASKIKYIATGWVYFKNREKKKNNEIRTV